MEWQQLLGFHQVAKLGSFTRAADATFRTQSALSQQVKALEGELECLLLERIGKKRLRLTPEGERLFKFAEALLSQYEGLREDLNEMKGGAQGHLRVAAPFTTLYRLFPERLRTYFQKFPNVHLTLMDRPQPGVVDLVREGEVDFGLVLASQAPGNLAVLRWRPVDTVLMTRRGHPLAGLKKVSWRQISRYPLILPPGGQEHGHRHLIEEHFRQRGLKPRVIMESANVELSARLVAMGLGIAFATVAREAEPQEPDLAFIPLTRYFLPDHLALIRRRDKVLSSYKKSFVNLLFGDTIL
jgi:DNA-binding transcriptional LysR family regulator